MQFEAVCSLQFETKFDSRVTFHKKTLNVIAKSLDSDGEGYQLSPVMVEVMEARRNFPFPNYIFLVFSLKFYYGLL